MQVLIGVDQSESAVEVAEWVEALGLSAVATEWMHVVPAQTGTVWALDPLLAASSSERLQERAASAMEQALREKSGPTPVRVRIGHPLTELLNRADETKTELIAVRSSNKGPLSAFLLGSIARGLVEGAHQSVLLTHGSAPQGKLRVVVATDHSEYLESALAQLAAWHPTGIGHLTLLHVLPPAYKAQLDQLAQEVAHEAYGRPIRTPEEVTQAAASALGTALGLPETAVHSRVEQGAVPAAIERVLDETDADLLILGAKGHSFLERLTLGSVSFRTVTTCPKSVLVLRV